MCHWFPQRLNQRRLRCRYGLAGARTLDSPRRTHDIMSEHIFLLLSLGDILSMCWPPLEQIKAKHSVHAPRWSETWFHYRKIICLFEGRFRGRPGSHTNTHTTGPGRLALPLQLRPRWVISSRWWKAKRGNMCFQWAAMTVGTAGHILPHISIYVYGCGLKRFAHLSFSFRQLASRQGDNINADAEEVEVFRATGKKTNITSRRSHISFHFEFYVKIMWKKSQMLWTKSMLKNGQNVASLFSWTTFFCGRKKRWITIRSSLQMYCVKKPVNLLQ